MDKKLAILAVLAIAALFLVPALKLGGTVFSSAQVQAISPTTLNGQPAVLVSLYGSGGADALDVVLSKSTDSRFQGTKDVQLVVAKQFNVIKYTITERSGASRNIYYYDLKTSCDGYAPFGTCQLGGMSSFKSSCLASNANNIFYDAGDLANPKWRCYALTPQWIVSDFDRAGTINDPGISVQVNTEASTLPSENWAEVLLTRSSPRQTLLTSSGRNIGEASMPGLSLSFLNPPASSGVKALRYANEYGPAFSYQLVDSSVENENTLAWQQFQSCMGNAKRSSAQQYAVNLGSIGIPIFESYDDGIASTCVSNLRSKITGLSGFAPTGDFKGADTSKLASERTISLTNQFSIPNVQLTLFADAVGISRATAAPASVSCQNKEIPGGAIADFSATVANGIAPGTLYWEATCAAPITVRTASGSVQLNGFESKTIPISISSGSSASTSTCTVTVKGTDLQNAKSATCTLTSNTVCQGTPKQNFIFDENCHEICPVPQSSCAQGTTLDTATCTCKGDSATCEPPYMLDPALKTCRPPVCPDGQTFSPTTRKCESGGTGSTEIPACLPVIQKLKSSTEGGIFGIGGTQIYTCETDFGGLIIAGAVLIGVAAFVRRRR